MHGRFHLRRPTTILVALVLALVLVLIASMGFRPVPATATAAVSPAATVVHLLGDEVVPAAPIRSVELRVRTLAPDDLALTVLLATLLGTIALASVVHRGNRQAVSRSLVPIPSAPGRSPPASRPHHR
jgi:hypothetical protein